MSTTRTRQGKVLANTFIKTYVSYLYEVRSGTCLGPRVALPEGLSFCYLDSRVSVTISVPNFDKVLANTAPDSAGYRVGFARLCRLPCQLARS